MGFRCNDSFAHIKQQSRRNEKRIPQPCWSVLSKFMKTIPYVPVDIEDANSGAPADKLIRVRPVYSPMPALPYTSLRTPQLIRERLEAIGITASEELGIPVSTQRQDFAKHAVNERTNEGCCKKMDTNRSELTALEERMRMEAVKVAYLNEILRRTTSEAYFRVNDMQRHLGLSEPTDVFGEWAALTEFTPSFAKKKSSPDHN